MKEEEKEKVLQILDFALKHPISSIFRSGAKNEDVYSLDKLREKIVDNYFSTPKQAFDLIYETIDMNIQEEDFLTTLGDELKRLLKKRINILFSTQRDWGLRVTKYRSRLADLTANPPLTVKNICQLSTRTYIKKPQIDFDTADDLNKLVGKLNRLLNNDENEEYYNLIRQIIDENEPEFRGKKEINIAELKHSTILEIKKYLQ